MKKSINKSIRISAKVFDYIDSYPGSSFNDKLDSLIIYAMETEADRKRCIIDLDESISAKRTELYRLGCEFSEFQSFLRDVAAMDRSFRKLKDKLDSYVS